MKINIISPQEHNFTQIISNIEQCPKKLYFIGKLPESRAPTIAIVGSRKPTTYGKEVTYKFASELAKYGFVIVSGLAVGVDSIAHKATLEAGGITVAILANGLNTIYPASNRNLANNIVANGGAIISEYEPNTPARDFQFLARNRIVSGLSDAILVTEAAVRSGTLSTVAHAIEQGREVFVVPGNITSPLSAGCNNLIKQGAYPVTEVDDIINVVAPEILKKQSVLPLGSTPKESKIIDLIQSGIRDGDELQIKSGLEVSEFSQTMTIMEINGIIRALGGNQWVIK